MWTKLKKMFNSAKSCLKDVILIVIIFSHTPFYSLLTETLNHL